MNLSNVTAVIRPRTAWEAMDLGVRLVQRDFFHLALRWVIATLPWAIISLSIGAWLNNYIWSFLIFWWMKPAFDRVVLQFLGRRLFSGDIGQTSLVNMCVKLPLSFSAWRHLSYLRFSLTRSFVLPVYQLEGQHVTTQPHRVQTILARDYGAAAWLTMSFFIISCVTHLTVASFLMSFWRPEVPYSTPLNFFDEYLHFWEFHPDWMVLLDFLAFYCVHGILELFYVGAGFALYLNRRTHLEAWDIELAFRRLSARVSKVTSVAVVCVLLGALIAQPQSVSAQENAEATPIENTDQFEQARALSRETVDTIFNSDEFGKHETVKKWQLKPNELDDPELDFQFFDAGAFIGIIITALTYLLIAFVVLIVLTWAFRNRGFLFPKSGPSSPSTNAAHATKIENQTGVKEAFTPNPDVPHQVKLLWAQDDQREAMSYLYRSALTYLTEKHQLIIDDSDTEGDCLALVKSKANSVVFDYFKNVTRAWRNLAYGEIPPSYPTLEKLCDNWPLLAEIPHER